MNTKRFILVDDDMFNNNLCKMYIQYVYPTMEIVDFTLPERGFEYLKSEFTVGEATPAILLLDINMPTMTGWDFLEKYEELDQRVKEQISIYILSSSVDPRDKEKADNNKYVKGYLEKPLQVDVIKKISQEIN
ncbi:MAG: response regulator [Bacteroidetes bacterium]|nr:response regulator [Bacteroidota bacterium]